MLKVGLTGNIASGKSVVASCWKKLGARLVDADELARRAVEPGTEALAAIGQRWGPGVVSADGTLNRAALRDIVFRDAVERGRLEQITHPAIRRLRDEEFAAAAREGAPLIVADVPLLYEVGMEKDFDLVVHVHSSAETRLRRLVELRGLDPDEARRMMESQMSSERKRGHADILIDNEGTLEALEERAREVWDELVRRSEAQG